MSKGGGNSAAVPANDTIEVTVEWNGQTEKFTLSPTGNTDVRKKVSSENDLSCSKRDEGGHAETGHPCPDLVGIVVGVSLVHRSSIIQPLKGGV